MNENDANSWEPGTGTVNTESLPADPYLILGVPRDASYETIRRSYRDKAKTCHPDLGDEPGRDEKFKLLNWAHRVLSERRPRSERGKEADPPPGGEPPKAHAADDSPAARLVREGRERLKVGGASEAESLARLALARAREDTSAYTLLGESLAAQARYPEAIGCLLLALQFDRNHAPAREALERLREREKGG